MRAFEILILSIFTLSGPLASDPVPGQWSRKLATDPGDVVRFLNGTAPYSQPVSAVRIAAMWKGDHAEFIIFYQQQPTAGATGGWGLKLATDPDDVQLFLNGSGSYGGPVGDARIAALNKAGHREFYVFYRAPAAGEPVGGWGWKRVTDSTDAMALLNGTGPYRHPVTTARIASVPRGDQDEFYIFYRGAMRGDPVANWVWRRATTVDDAFAYVNGQGIYTRPLPGFATAALWRSTHARFYVFGNRGTRIWLQTPLQHERFVAGETVPLFALVTSDRPLDCGELGWTSSRDGALDNGCAAQAELSVGSHLLEVTGYGQRAAAKAHVFADLGELYRAPPGPGEIARLEQDFTLEWIDGTGVEEVWAVYPDVFDQESTDPARRVAYARLDVLRHQRFAEPLPMTGGETIYDHLKSHVTTLRLRLDCGYNSGGGGKVSLNRNFSVWDSRASGTPSDPEACKQPFSPPTFHPYVSPLYLLIHEARHNQPDDPGHTSCGGESNMDPSLEDGSGHAWATLYTMWVYKYGLYDPPEIKNEARMVAASLLASRFCSPPQHSDPRVRKIVDELLAP